MAFPFVARSVVAQTPLSLFVEEANSQQSGGVATLTWWSNVALGKATEQSSSYAGITGAPAVNGKTGSGGISHTDIQAQAWWLVNLGGAHEIGEVRLFNRSDGCQERLSNLDVSISLDRVTWQSIYVAETVGMPTIVDFGGRIGQYVKVQLRGTDYLSLAEAQVMGRPASVTSSSASQALVNVALGKPTAQSSSYAGVTGDPAVNGQVASGGVSHTDLQAQPWWMVDLGAPHAISQVQLYNRTDCCQERLANLGVSIRTDGGAWQSIWVAGTIGSPTTVDFGGQVGRYVLVQLTGENYLSLAEVKVVGRPVPVTGGSGGATQWNVALGKATAQSSSYAGITGAPAVDGDTAWRGVSHTAYEAQPWWLVNLGAPYKIGAVRLFNRPDGCQERLSNLDVSISLDRVTWQPIYVAQTVGAPTSVDFGGQVGQYVKVQLRGADYLSLAEVQVMGSPTAPALTPEQVQALVDAQVARDGSAVVRYRTVRVATVADDSPRLNIALFDGQTVTLVMDGFEQVGSRTVWSGHISGMTGSQAILVRNQGHLVGLVQWPGSLFHIRWAGADVHVLEEKISRGTAQLGTSDVVEGGAADASSSAVTAAGTSDEPPSTIDVLVVYTPAALAAAGDIERLRDDLALTFNSSNLVLRDSGIRARLVFLRDRLVDYTETDDLHQDVKNLRDGVGGLQLARTYRDAIGADTVTLIVESSASPPGVAYSAHIDPDDAFNVVERSELGTRTFLHETGHSMGSVHDAANASGPGYFKYSYGFRRPGGYYTIMSYDCSESANCPGCAPCQECWLFSSPDLFGPDGLPLGFEDTFIGANNVRSLNETRGLVAAYRSRPPIPPAPQLVAPSGIVRALKATFAWEGSSLATVYKLTVDWQTPSGKLETIHTSWLANELCRNLECRVDDITVMPGDHLWTVEAQNVLGVGTVSDPARFSVPSCYALGQGGFCSNTSSCPADSVAVGATYDCPVCCAATGTVVEPLASCGEMGGNSCAEGGTCPNGYEDLGPSSNCERCCKGPYLGCEALGGSDAFCSDDGTCPTYPVYTEAIGPGLECALCCRVVPSTTCLQMGGDTCGVSTYYTSTPCPPDYTYLGPSSDCLACCRWNYF